MAIAAIAHVTEMRLAPNGELLTSTEKLVALLIANYYNTEAGYAWPSMERLAEDSLISERQCRRIVRQLEDKGVITVDVGGRSNGVYLANRYGFPGLSAPKKAAVAEIVSPAPTAPADVTAETALSATVLAEGLREVIDAYLVDYQGDPMSAYLAGLEAAQVLASDHPGLSKNLAQHLRNVVISHAAEFTHGAAIPGKAHPRLYKAAATLGPQGAEWIITALCWTETAAITGDATAYVIRAAQNRKAGNPSNTQLVGSRS
jgi:hypothetical protein